MPATFLLLLLVSASSLLAVLSLVWALGFIIFTNRKQYGVAIIGGGVAGGIAGLLIALAAGWMLGLVQSISGEIWLAFFTTGFGFVGCTVGALGFIAPWFQSQTRWSDRQRNRLNVGGHGQ